MQYGTRIFEKGDVGEIVNVPYPLRYRNDLIYDFYVQFEHYAPLGVFKDEVEEIK
jgi:hypothetical protein